MADDFCFALLRTTSLQILQSAGFESVQLSSADAMTDILGQYLELLANTVTNFAQLSGRTDGNALDVLDGLAELNINIEDLEDWLNVEGKDFIPTWSEQADPSRVLDGIINTKKEDIDNSFTFEYSDSDSWDDLDALISSPMSGINTSPSFSPPPSPSTQHNNNNSDNLPKYVPDYLPTFPVLNKEDEMDPLNDVKELQTTLPSSSSQTNNPLPHHLTVKKKKKPITNPFTHITPYEESIIATDKDTPTPMALSALEISASTMGGAPSSPTPPYSTSEQRDIPLKRVMESFDGGKDSDQPLKKQKFASSSLSSSKESLTKIFQQATQDDASAGTRLFGRSTSILGDIVRNLAPPLALSTLSTPNLMVDMIGNNNNNNESSLSSSDTNNGSSSTSNLSSSTSAPNLITIPAKSDINNGNSGSGSSGISLTISTKNITSAPSSPTKSTAISIKTKSASMNPSLKREDDDIFSINSLEKDRKEPSSNRPRSASSSSTSLVFSPPPPIPSTITTTSGSPISLASLANKATSISSSSSKQQSQKSARKLTINLSNLQKKSEDHPLTPSLSSASSTNKSPRNPKSVTIKASSSTPSLNDHHQHKSKTLTSSSSTSSLSNTNSNGSSNNNNNNNNVTTTASTSSSYHHQPYSSPSPIVSPSSATAPKIRFTLKPPEPIIKAEPISPTTSSLPSSILSSHSTSTSRPISTTTSSSQSLTSKSKTNNNSNNNNNNNKNNNTISLKKAPTTQSSSSATKITTTTTTAPVPPPLSSTTSYQYNNNVNNNYYYNNTTSSSSSEQVEDIIRCICENPTIDYGAFMIACDKCGVWYHGSCVGVSENDQVEEWYCQSCQTLN